MPMKVRMVMSVARLRLKRSSGSIKEGRERSVVGVSRKDDVSVATLDCDGRVGFETRSRDSEGGRTAAEAPVTTTSTILRMSLIVTFDKEPQSTSLSPLTKMSIAKKQAISAAIAFILDIETS